MPRFQLPAVFEHWQALAEALMVNRSLLHLGLERNGISDSGKQVHCTANQRVAEVWYL